MGISNERIFNRWIIVVTTIIIQTCLGTVYAFNVLPSPLKKEFSWSDVEAISIMIALLVFALSMMPAGRLQDKKGSRLVAAIGGVLPGLGMISSSYTSSLPWLYKLWSDWRVRHRPRIRDTDFHVHEMSFRQEIGKCVASRRRKAMT